MFHVKHRFATNQQGRQKILNRSNINNQNPQTYKSNPQIYKSSLTDYIKLLLNSLKHIKLKSKVYGKEISNTIIDTAAQNKHIYINKWVNKQMIKLEGK